VHSQIPGNVVGACFGLSAFAVALLGGLAAERSASSILGAATVSLLICYVVGLIVAKVAEVAIKDVQAPTRTSGAPKRPPTSTDRAAREAA
jgi:hypothetical protein